MSEAGKGQEGNEKDQDEQEEDGKQGRMATSGATIAMVASAPRCAAHCRLSTDEEDEAQADGG